MVVPVRRGVRAYIGWFCFVVIAYYAAAHLGYALRFAGPVASIVWLPVGVGIAALYLVGPQFWPAVVVGDLLVNNYSTLPAGSAIGQSFGNLLEVLTAALLMRRFAARNPLLG
jgi:integral membrane sensor domain MASE1